MKYEKVEVITQDYPKEMLCWNSNKESAIELLVIAKVEGSDFPYKAINTLGSIGSFSYAEELEKSRTIKEGIHYGDILKHPNVGTTKVLGVVDEVVILSFTDNHDVASDFKTLKELVSDGYDLKADKNIENNLVHLTLKDVSEGKGKGIDPSLLRIKE